MKRGNKGISIPGPQDYFFFPLPIVNSSKLRRVSSLTPLVAARVKEEDLDSKPGCNLWVVEIRPLPEPSLGSPEELGLLLETTALFELLPVRERRPLSESIFWKWKRASFNSEGFGPQIKHKQDGKEKKRIRSILGYHVFRWRYFIRRSVSQGISVPSAKCLHRSR